jgi:hypothetical protein
MDAAIDEMTLRSVNQDLGVAQTLISNGIYDAAAVTIRAALERVLFAIVKAEDLWSEACTDRDGQVYKEPKPARAIYVLGSRKVIDRQDRLSLQEVNRIGNAGAHAIESVTGNDARRAFNIMSGSVQRNASGSAETTQSARYKRSVAPTQERPLEVTASLPAPEESVQASNSSNKGAIMRLLQDLGNRIDPLGKREITVN